MHDGHSHTHEHTHEGHDHSHSHAHEHSHDEQSRPHGGALHQLTHLLDFMLEHNRSHTAELAGFARQLREKGQDAAAAKLEEGVKDFERGNDSLKEALGLIESGE